MRDAYIMDDVLYLSFEEMAKYIRECFSVFLPNDGSTHRFNIINGKVTPGREFFITPHGQAFKLKLEDEYELYVVDKGEWV